MNLDRRIMMGALAAMALPAVAQPVAQRATAEELARIRAAAALHPGWLYISRRCTDEQDLEALCRLHGWTTVAEVTRFVDLIGKTFSHAEVLGMTPNAAPAFNREAMPVVPWEPRNAPIHSAIARDFKLPADLKIGQSDRTYRALTHAQIVQFAQAWTPRRAYKPTKMDCDKFTKGFIGWMCDNGYGGCLGFFGYQAYNLYGQHLGAHAVSLAVDVDEKCWLIDHMPISAGVWPASTVRLGGYTTAWRIEPTRIDF